MIAPLLPAGGAGEILKRVFAVLDAAEIAHCVLHGHDRLDGEFTGDVDCAIDPALPLRDLLQLLHAKSGLTGASVVRAVGFHLTLAGRKADGSPSVLELDFAAGRDVEGLVFYSTEDILASRRRQGWFWRPSAAIGFGNYLTRVIATGRLDARRGAQLAHAFAQDPKAAQAEIARHWPAAMAATITTALRSGDGSKLITAQGGLRQSLVRAAIRRKPAAFIGHKLGRMAARLQRLWQPQGMSVVILGPDGAGKSSLIEDLTETAAPLFSRSDCWGFAPAIRRLLGGRATPTNTPHALKPRAGLASLMRAGYWLAYNSVKRIHLGVSKARSTLVLYDRHFLDIFVDPLRYRYGGPRWALDLVWRLMPKPDLVVLLSADAKIIHARKQEVSLATTERQLCDYRALIAKLSNGQTVDAAQSPQLVANAVKLLIHDFLAARLARRFKLDTP